eukprot:gene11588-biopygen5586
MGQRCGQAIGLGNGLGGGEGTRSVCRVGSRPGDRVRGASNRSVRLYGQLCCPSITWRASCLFGGLVTLRSCKGRHGSLDLHGGVDHPHESPRGEEANAAEGEGDGKGGEERHLEEDRRSEPSVEMENGEEVVHGIEEEVEAHARGDEDGRPPPPVVLEDKLVINDYDGGEHGGDEDDEEHEAEEAEDVVDHPLPQARQDEAQLDEGSPERDDAGDDEEDDLAHVPTLRGDLPLQALHLHGVLDRGDAEAVRGAEQQEREGDAEPQPDQRSDGGERHGVRGLPRPQEDHRGGPPGEEDPRVAEARGEEPLPLLPTEHLLQDGGDEAVRQPHQHEEEEEGGKQAAAVGGGEEPGRTYVQHSIADAGHRCFVLTSDSSGQ